MAQATNHAAVLKRQQLLHNAADGMTHFLTGTGSFLTEQSTNSPAYPLGCMWYDAFDQFWCFSCK
jgi:hypothetical protein